MISIVIPNFNRADIIGKSIESVLKSGHKDFEVIVVDDASSDNSLDVIKRYPVTLEALEKNSGPSVARNAGARRARGDVIVFMDSDVVMPKDALHKIESRLSDKSISAVSSIPRFESTYKNLASSHFNWRVHFNYINLPDFIDFTYGSFVAVKKDAFESACGFNEALKTAGVEDDEFGHDLVSKGHNILADKALQIAHCKKLDIIGLLRNDFRRTLDRVDYLLRRKKIKDTRKNKRFISTPLSQMLSPFAIGAFWLTLFLSVIHPAWVLFSLTFLFIFFLCYAKYLAFLARMQEARRVPFVFGLLVLDMTVVACGLGVGIIKWVKAKIWRNS